MKDLVYGLDGIHSQL